MSNNNGRSFLLGLTVAVVVLVGVTIAKVATDRERDAGYAKDIARIDGELRELRSEQREGERLTDAYLNALRLDMKAAGLNPPDMPARPAKEE